MYTSLTGLSHTDFGFASFSQEQWRADIALLRVEGELTNKDAAVLRAVIESVNDRPSVVIDLSRCTFMDSSCMGTLIQARSQVLARHGEFWLIVPPGDIRQSLEIARLDRLFQIYDSRDAARQELQAPLFSVASLTTTHPRERGIA